MFGLRRNRARSGGENKYQFLKHTSYISSSFRISREWLSNISPFYIYMNHDRILDREATKAHIENNIAIVTGTLATPCWFWKLGTFPNGYGQLWQLGEWSAHRVSYAAFVGPIPKGMCVLHRCDNKPCVNPDHLWAGTNVDNMRDMVAKGRNPKRTPEQHSDNSRKANAAQTPKERSERQKKAWATRVARGKATPEILSERARKAAETVRKRSLPYL